MMLARRTKDSWVRDIACSFVVSLQAVEIWHTHFAPLDLSCSGPLVSHIKSSLDRHRVVWASF
jgi:hypothetical protein